MHFSFKSSTHHIILISLLIKPNMLNWGGDCYPKQMP